MSCLGFPRHETITTGADGLTRAWCLCRRELVLIQNVPDRRDTWRHKRKVKVLR